jgi:8-oxo-dGTP pyrophosphatase MutT (NUDIX family)
MSTSPETFRQAATVILLRDAEEGPEIFMVVRHHQIDFASGALVFPGGSLDPDDRRIAERPEWRVDVPGADVAAMTFRIAAIREAFEECGVLLARRAGADNLLPAGELAAIDKAHRQALCAGTISFAAIIEEERLVLATDLLEPFAHWITPVGMPKRFDTHFFLAIAPEDQAALHDGGEAVDSTWITASQALSEAKAGRYTLVFATERNLYKLAPHNSAAELLAAARNSDIVTVQPEIVKTPTGRQLHIPAAAGYGGDVFEF